jgi:hypothetical protein
MAGSVVDRGFYVRWGKRLGAALLFAVGLATASCSSDSPSSGKSGEIPPPLDQLCNTDADCGAAGLKCDPLRGCLPCVFDWHCADGERCTDDGCKVPKKCGNDGECSSDSKAPHCDPVLGECVGCRTESDCPENAHCVERSCATYTPCVNSRDCTTGTVCDRDAGECVECLGNGDCEKDKEVCVASHCVPVCTSDKDCLARNQLCHHDKGYCADCVEQEDCPGVYYCSADLCKLDVCKAGERKCTSSSTYSVCNANGSAAEESFCPISTTCKDEAGAAVCKPWICTPGTSDCDAAGQRLQQCALDGLSFASSTDCTADGQLCHMAECKPKVCEPGSMFCEGSNIRECLANGTSSVVNVPCGITQYCDEASVTCTYRKCTPGAAMCDGAVATKCDELGRGPAPEGTDCSKEDALCRDGECRPVLCTGRFCKDGDAWLCLEEGTATQLDRACSMKEFCLDGYCVVDECTGGQPVCNGGTATTCKADGSGPEAGGTDCEGNGEACVNGACIPKVCAAGTYFCLNGNPQLCSGNGTSYYQWDSCSQSEYCKEGFSSCQYDQCTGGSKLCNGTVATTCAADGSGPLAGGTDCALDSKVCYQGACLPKVCEPNQYFCQSGNSYLCGPSGATSSLSDTCLTSEFCKPGSYSCQPDICTAAAPTCNGDLLSTCAADGSGPVDAGKSCGAGKTCFAGACADVVCTPDALQCAGGNVQICADKGTVWKPYSTCGAAYYCDELATPITCSPDTCTPSGNACNGEKLATCSADGGHFTATSTDCAASKKVCTLSATCAETAEDTVGANTSSVNENSYMMGNIYRVDRARYLTEIEQYLSVSGVSLFTWVVYEAGAPSFGTFAKVYEGTNSASGMGAFISSGAINVPLVAGKYYFIGVVVQGSFTTYYQNSTATPFVSFGQLSNSYQVYTSTAPASVYLSSSSMRFNQRLSTALPQ